MRRMGIDYGTKRIGIALTDEGGTMAFPHEVLTNTDSVIPDIVQIINEYNVEEVVVGHSKDANNVDNALQVDIESLIQDLTLQVGTPVHLEPEQYTTQEAIRVQGRNEKTDAAAATIILNSYLSKHANDAQRHTTRDLTD